MTRPPAIHGSFEYTILLTNIRMYLCYSYRVRSICLQPNAAASPAMLFAATCLQYLSTNEPDTDTSITPVESVRYKKYKGGVRSGRAGTLAATLQGLQSRWNHSFTSHRTRGGVISPKKCVQELRLVRGQSMRKRRPLTGAQTRCLGGVLRAWW